MGEQRSPHEVERLVGELGGTLTSRSYLIRLQGVAGPGTVAAFSDVELSTEDGCTVLHTRATDQAALHGLLNRILDLGLELVEVTPDEAFPGRH